MKERCINVVPTLCNVVSTFFNVVSTLCNVVGWDSAKDQEKDHLARLYVSYFQNRDKNSGITIISKNNEEAEYPYISTSWYYGYRTHKTRVLLARKQYSTLFADKYVPNGIA